MTSLGGEEFDTVFKVDLPPRPYPGLRPFKKEEWPIFFGRERMTDAIVAQLIGKRLLVVHGDSGCGKSSLIGAGVLIGAVGLLLLADRFADRDVPLVTAWWPFLIIALGTIRLVNPEPPPRRGGRRSGRSGAWLVVVGLWGLANEAHLFGFHYGNSWPLLVIAVGAMMIWSALDPGCRPAVRRER